MRFAKMMVFGFIALCLAASVSSAETPDSGVVSMTVALPALSVPSRLDAPPAQNLPEERLRQAKALWDKKFAEKIGFKFFEDYLETVPPIPKFTDAVEQKFPLLVLVDARLTSEQACSLIALRCYGHQYTAAKYSEVANRTEGSVGNTDVTSVAGGAKIYWMRIRDGRDSQWKVPTEVVKTFWKTQEVGLTAREGLAVFIQHPEAIKGNHMYLMGTSHVLAGKKHTLWLGSWGGAVGLDFHPNDMGALMTFGTPSRYIPSSGKPAPPPKPKAPPVKKPPLVDGSNNPPSVDSSGVKDSIP